MTAVTEEQIAELVRVFYGRARAHADLGPLFHHAIVDWDEHLRIICDFWSHVLLGTHRYKRNAYPPHMNLPIRREHFDQWLELFRQSALETLPEKGARRAIARAELMTESFRAGLFPFDPVREKSPDV